MKEGLLQAKKCVQQFVSNQQIVTNILSINIVMEGHKTQTKDALISVQLAVDILTDCTVNDTKDIF